MMITYRPANTQDYHEVNTLLSDTQRLHAEMLPMNFEKNATVLSPTQYQSMLFYSTNDILVAVYNQEIVGVSVVELMYTPAVNQYRLENVPLASIFAATQSKRLQLITCAGPYEEGVGYRDRIVVTARLIQ